MKNTSLTFFFLFCLFLVSASAQQIPPAPRSTPPETAAEEDVVKISTNLIQLDVTVTDKNGNQVADLKPEDFEVFENGERQEITNLSYVSVAAQTKTEVNRAKQQKEIQALINAPPVVKKLKANEVRRTVALVVDDLSIAFAGMWAVKQALKNFVNNQMLPDDLVAVIRVSGGSGVFQQFTSDKRILLTAIDKIKPNVSKINSFTQITNVIVDDPLYVARRDSRYALGTIGAVNYLIKSMDKLPGRKALVLFSEGFALFSRKLTKLGDPNTNKILPPPDPDAPKDPNHIPLSRDTSTDIVELASEVGSATRVLTELANRAGVTINTVDSRGLALAMKEAGDGRTDLPGLTASGFGMNAEQLSDSVTDRQNLLTDTQSTMIYLAEETGGRAFINNNDLKGAVQKAVNDQNGYYLLGYQPEEEVFDPKKRKFNKIEIRLKNRPELRVKYRSGFFGIADEKVMFNKQATGQDIAETLFSPFDSDEIDVDLTPVYFSDAKSADFISALLYIDGKNLSFTKDADGGTMKGDFEVLGYTFDVAGKVVDRVAKTYSLSLNEESYRKLIDKGLIYTINVPIKKTGGYQMRIAFRDAKNKKIGSASQFIEVPNRKKNKLVLSGILLQNYPSAESMKVKLTAAGGDARDHSFQTDTAVRKFKAGTFLSYVYEVYNAGAGLSKKVQFQSQTRLFRDGQLVAEGKNEPLTWQADAPKNQTQGVMRIGKDLTPGSYVLQVLVFDDSEKGKKQAAMQYIDFEVVD